METAVDIGGAALTGQTNVAVSANEPNFPGGGILRFTTKTDDVAGMEGAGGTVD